MNIWLSFYELQFNESLNTVLRLNIAADFLVKTVLKSYSQSHVPSSSLRQLQQHFEKSLLFKYINNRHFKQRKSKKVEGIKL